MNFSFLRPLGLALLLCLVPSSDLRAQEKQAESKPPTAAEKAHSELLLPGVSLAEGITEITGVAISPLLGVSALGAWTYYRTDASLRHRLPWYCHPYIWGAGLAIIGICFLKDFLGAAAPALVKKPLDFLELFEDKLSALVASAGFVPLVALAVTQVERLQMQASQDGAIPGLAMMPLGAVLDLGLQTPWIAIPAAVLAFAVVWLSSHALNVLIALSPFGIVDAGLKLTKLALLTVVTASALLHPIAGAAVSLVLILIGCVVAGWSFRLTVFGTLMGSDLLLMKRASEADIRSGVRGFLARRTDGVPVRSYGRLELDEAGFARFVWRPWLVLPQRRMLVPESGMVMCKGLLHPTVAHRPPAEQRPRHSLILLPRYRKLEEKIAAQFGCQEVMDSALMRGFRAMRQWLVDALSMGRSLVEQRAP